MKRILDFFLPPLCLSCKDRVLDPGSLCGACWAQMQFVQPPLCDCCGRPFDYDLGDKTLCSHCLKKMPHFDHARAALSYGHGSKKLILRFKHGDQTHLAGPMAQWLIQAAGDLLDDADYLLPVPLHWRRLFFRRYNQAALLCHEISKREKIPVLVDLLRRTKATRSQGGLGRAKRIENVKNVFEVNARYAQQIKGKVLVLVDDVITTGATVDACARVLKMKGAKKVIVLSIARVTSLAGQF